MFCVCGKRGKLNKRNQSKITTIPKCVGLCLPSPQHTFSHFLFLVFRLPLCVCHLFKYLLKYVNLCAKDLLPFVVT